MYTTTTTTGPINGPNKWTNIINLNLNTTTTAAAATSTITAAATFTSGVIGISSGNVILLWDESYFLRYCVDSQYDLIGQN